MSTNIHALEQWKDQELETAFFTYFEVSVEAVRTYCTQEPLTRVWKLLERVFQLRSIEPQHMEEGHGSRM
jgi:hypothetical protein